MAILDDRDMLALIDSLQTSKLVDTPPIGLVDLYTAVASLVKALAKLPTSPPSLYLDLEGVSLSRHGSVSILQVHVSPNDRTFLFDIQPLGKNAFSTAGSSGQTLKGILESDSIPKVFFDVRNDSHALFSHYGIKLACIHDIQLMELATRSFSKRCVNGLMKCIERDISLSVNERGVWRETKEKGLYSFALERGGDYEVFNARPLPEDVLLYCIQDAHFMLKLWRHYNSNLKVVWAA